MKQSSNNRYAVYSNNGTTEIVIHPANDTCLIQTSIPIANSNVLYHDPTFGVHLEKFEYEMFSLARAIGVILPPTTTTYVTRMPMTGGMKKDTRLLELINAQVQLFPDPLPGTAEDVRIIFANELLNGQTIFVSEHTTLLCLWGHSLAEKVIRESIRELIISKVPGGRIDSPRLPYIDIFQSVKNIAEFIDTIATHIIKESENEKRLSGNFTQMLLNSGNTLEKRALKIKKPERETITYTL